MKRLPKYTPAEVRNDPYGFTYKEMSEVIGENEATCKMVSGQKSYD